MLAGRKSFLLTFFAICFMDRALAYPDALLKSIPLSSKPFAIAGSTANERFLYALSSEDNSITTVDALLWKEVASITLQGVPRGVALDLDGKKMYVLSDQSDVLHEFSIETPSTTVLNTKTTIPTSGVQFDQILFSKIADDEKIFLLSQSQDKIYVYHPQTNALETIEPGIDLVSMALANANKLVVLGSTGIVKVYSTNSLSAIGNQLDLGSFTTPTAFSQVIAPVTGLGNYGFVTRTSDPGEVWKVNMTQATTISNSGSIAVGANPVSSVVMNVLRPANTSGASYLYTANTTDQSLSVTNLAAVGGPSSPLIATITGINNVTKEGFFAAPQSGYLYAVDSVNKAISVISDQPLVSVSNYPASITSETSLSGSVSSSRSGQLSVVLYQGDENEIPDSANGVNLASMSLDTNVSKTVSISADQFEEGTNTIGFFVKNGDYVGQSAMEVVKDTVPGVPKGFRLLFGNEKIFVRWEKNTEKDLDHYLIYFGTTDAAGGGAGALASPISVQQGSGENMEYILSPIANGTQVFVQISAVDKTGHESDKTSVLSETTEETVGILSLSNEHGGCASAQPTLLLFFTIVFAFFTAARRNPQVAAITVLKICVLTILLAASAQADLKYSFDFGVGWWVPKDQVLRQFIGKQGNEKYSVRSGIGTENFMFSLETGLVVEKSPLLGISSGRKSGETQDLFLLSAEPALEYALLKRFYISPFVKVGHSFDYFSIEDPTKKVAGLKQATVLSGGLRLMLDRVLISNDPSDMFGINHIYVELMAAYKMQWTSGLSFGGWTFTPSIGIEF